MPHSSTGSCLCKTIRYTLHGAPITRVLCHCKNCKKASGSSFQANLFFKQDQLTFTAGEDQLTHYVDDDTDSGVTPTRSFCSVCGSNVVTTNEGSAFVRGKVIVMSGCLDGDGGEFMPELEFYEKDKCAWMRVLVETQKFEGMT